MQGAANEFDRCPEAVYCAANAACLLADSLFLHSIAPLRGHND